MGVAVMERRCGATVPLVTSFCRWMVPKRCCSSMMAYAKYLNESDFSMSVCVPMTIGISPFATIFLNIAFDSFADSSYLTLEGNFRHSLPVMRPIGIGWSRK